MSESESEQINKLLISSLSNETRKCKFSHSNGSKEMLQVEAGHQEKLCDILR